MRFEIYDRPTFERIVRFRGEQGEDWKSIADGYEILVLETEQEPTSHVQDFLAEPGATRALQRSPRHGRPPAGDVGASTAGRAGRDGPERDSNGQRRRGDRQGVLQRSSR